MSSNADLATHRISLQTFHTCQVIHFIISTPLLVSLSSSLVISQSRPKYLNRLGTLSVKIGAASQLSLVSGLT